jgi:hypothetical protein
LRVEEGRLRIEVAAGRLAGPALPRLLLPVSEAAGFADGEAFGFDIAVAPRGFGRMIRYRGRLKAEDA